MGSLVTALVRRTVWKQTLQKHRLQCRKQRCHRREVPHQGLESEEKLNYLNHPTKAAHCRRRNQLVLVAGSARERLIVGQRHVGKGVPVTSPMWAGRRALCEWGALGLLRCDGQRMGTAPPGGEEARPSLKKLRREEREKVGETGREPGPWALRVPPGDSLRSVHIRPAEPM